MNELEAVFWDIGGVILDLTSVRRAHRAFVRDLCARHDLGVDEETAIERWQSAVGDHFRAREGTEFRAAREAYGVGVEVLVGEPLEATDWRPRFREVVEETIEPVEGAPAAIETLAGRDLHVGVISDVDDAEGRAMLEHFGVARHLDSITTSEAVGRTKPDPVIFETALDTAGVVPGRSAMVGDRYEHDVAGAAAVGMQTIAFGADAGPAVDYRIEEPREVVAIVDGDRSRFVEEA